MSDLAIGWLTFGVLKRMRANENTNALGKWSYLSMRAVGADWGEAEWTAADLVRARPSVSPAAQEDA